MVLEVSRRDGRVCVTSERCLILSKKREKREEEKLNNDTEFFDIGLTLANIALIRKLSGFAKGWWVVLRRRRDSAKGSLWTRHGNE